MAKEHKVTNTMVETILFTREEAEKWEIPPFQRDTRVNSKVQKIATELQATGGIIPGILTFGVLNKKKYIVDGLHRRMSFMMSGLEEGYADTRTCFFETMAEMADEYVRLNDSIARMKPDDILRGLEPSNHAMQKIRKLCPFVGYDSVRRNDKSPVLSMSSVIRSWAQSAPEVASSTGMSAAAIAESMSDDDATNISAFLNLAMAAWGRDQEYIRLWTSINITLCMWLYRRTVLTTYSAAVKRIDSAQFGRCLQSLSADPGYCDWLVGRSLGEKSRAPAYNRIKAIFVSRLEHDTGEKRKLPAPAWAHGGGRR